ncbi:MAG: MFS transporter, partial [Opitutaceae bacterium]|nr:MFS transporter [Opitutaceae bacterium]
MFADSSAPARPRSERTILLTLAAIQFTHVLDFMIMMPLGAELMEVFALTPGQFSQLVAAYGGAAALAGLSGGLFIDRMERRRALVLFYAGFILATLACAFAPTHPTLLAARFLAGVFGGLAGSLVVACVGDVVPPERRGRGMAFVMSAFPLASIAGVPLGILLANRFEWHAPFFLIVALALPTLALALQLLPRRPADPAAIAAHPFQQLRTLLSEPIHWRGFAVTASLVGASGAIIPFMAPSLVANVGLAENQLPWVYFFGGLATFASTPLIGWLTDRHDKLHVLAAIT